MVQLTADECRVLGVLIEKELTTPEQYPLTLNGVVNGCSQKNNRDPVVQYDEAQAFEAVEGLRRKGLVVRVDTVGSRTPKYRQEASQRLALNRFELVLLAEMLLRGPQTVGELRGRASRMHHLDSMEIVQETLGNLMRRDEPLVKPLSPTPGSRAERYMQTLCPDAHGTASPEPPVVGECVPSLSERVRKMEEEMAKLKEAVRRMAEGLGEPTNDL